MLTGTKKDWLHRPQFNCCLQPHRVACPSLKSKCPVCKLHFSHEKFYLQRFFFSNVLFLFAAFVDSGSQKWRILTHLYKKRRSQKQSQASKFRNIQKPKSSSLSWQYCIIAFSPSFSCLFCCQLMLRQQAALQAELQLSR